MYIGEYMSWFGSTVSKSLRKELKMEYISNDLNLSDLEQDYTKISMSQSPRPIGPYYAYNETYLEIRGGMFENFRGILTWICGVIFTVPALAIKFFIEDLIFLSDSEKVVEGDVIFSTIFFFIVGSIFLYLYIRYGRYIYRLEIFTLRHIRVRFNRVTQQVYIQRPKYCGGTVIFKWQDVIPANFLEPDHMDKTNMVNLISFHPYKTGFPAMNSVGIGKNTYHAQDYRDEWEFIRRYMEAGPANLPKPRITSLIPLPWHGFTGHIKPMLNFYKTNRNPILWLLMLPLFGVLLPFYTIGYFVSECLCWQPRWAKTIRQAGKKGAPKPPETKLSNYPEAVQQRLIQNVVEWSVRDDKTGKYIEYGNCFIKP